MNTRADGGPAYPCMPPQDTAAGSAVGYPHPDSGMTLRDYFAAKAMATVLFAITEFPDEHWRVGVAKDAYMMADAMLKAREVPA